LTDPNVRTDSTVAEDSAFDHGRKADQIRELGYDAFARLITSAEKISAGTTNASWAGAYDKNGNRTSDTAVLAGVIKTTSQGYNAIDELISLNGSSAGVSYDANGNQKTNPGNSSIGVVAVTASTVNGRDQITAATLGTGAHTTAGYLGETQTTLLTANNGAFTTTFSNTMLGLTRETGDGLTVSFVRTPDVQLIAATTGTSSAYFLTDNLGSTVGILSSAGAKTASYAYDPYGRTRTATGPSAAGNAFRYAGGLYDPTTGATKFGARYYDPNVGRFTQPDPSGQEQNPYAYAGCNPASANDPTGLDCYTGYATAVLASFSFLGSLVSGNPFTAAGSAAAYTYGVGQMVVGCDSSIYTDEETPLSGFGTT
jgi:RHS repeat-associated protein